VSEATRSAADVLAALGEHGCVLSVKTRTEEVEHRAGVQLLTYASKLKVSGAEPLPPKLRADVAAHLNELLAAACVLRPPVAWLAILVERYRESRVPLTMLAANVAAFIGQHPARDGLRYEALINHALGFPHPARK
jgi:hypothetical protein